MTLKEYVAAFDKLTETSSTVFRPLALGGFAIAWLFKHEDKITSISTIPKEFKNPLGIFALSLTSDLLQLFIPALFIGIHAIYLQLIKNKKADDEIEVHYLIQLPSWLFYILKMVLLAIGYILLYFSIKAYFK